MATTPTVNGVAGLWRYRRMPRDDTEDIFFQGCTFENLRIQRRRQFLSAFIPRTMVDIVLVKEDQ